MKDLCSAGYTLSHMHIWREARYEDYSRLELAIHSGAQIIVQITLYRTLICIHNILSGYQEIGWQESILLLNG